MLDRPKRTEAVSQVLIVVIAVVIVIIVFSSDAKTTIAKRMPVQFESTTKMLHIRNIRKIKKYEKQNRKNTEEEYKNI